MPQVLFDEKNEAHFLEKGYALPEAVPEAVLEALLRFTAQRVPDNIQGFHTTHFSTDSDYKKQIHDGLIDIVNPYLQKILVRHVPVFANFMLKPGGGNNPMPLHADWTYVDEADDFSLSVWIPLTDTVPLNGCIGVIPYSQHLSHAIRGPRIKQAEFPCNETLIAELGRLIPLKAGQPLIYDHRLLHYSTANDTPILRPAVNISLVPRGAHMIHYTWPEGTDRIRRYEVEDPDFFTEYDNFQIPQKGKLTGELASVPLLNERSEAFIRRYRPSFFKRLKSSLKLRF